MADIKYIVANATLPSGASDPSWFIDTTSIGTVKGCILSAVNYMAVALVHTRSMSLGLWDTTNTVSMGVAARNSAYPIESARAFRTDKILCIPNASGTDYQIQYSLTPTSSGLYINWDSGNEYANFYANIVVFGGADIALQVGTFNLPASGTTTSITSLANKPNAIWCASIGESGVGLYNNDVLFSMGVAAQDGANIVQNSTCLWYQDGVSAASSKAYLASSGVIDIISSGSLLYESNISSFNSNGFSVYTPYGNPNSALVGYISFYSPKINIKLKYANTRYWGAAGSVQANWNYQDTDYLTRLFLSFGSGSGFASGGGTMSYDTLYTHFRFSIGACLYVDYNNFTQYSIYFGNTISNAIATYIHNALAGYNNTAIAITNIWYSTYKGGISRSVNQLRQGNGRYFILCFEDTQKALRFGNKLLLVR